MGAAAIIPALGVAAALATTAATVIPMTQKPPKPPVIPTAATVAPTATKTDAALTSEVDQAESQRKRLAASRRGQNSTILTGPLGAESGTTATPSLLGS